DVDHGHTAREFRQTLLELLAIVIARRLFDLTANLTHSTLNVVLFAFAFDNGGVFLVDGNALGFAQLIQLHVLELDPEIFRDATIFQKRFHRFRIGYEVGREITFIELHTFDYFKGSLDRLGFLDGNSSILAYFVHRVGNDLADGLVPVS